MGQWIKGLMESQTSGPDAWSVWGKIHDYLLYAYHLLSIYRVGNFHPDFRDQIFNLLNYHPDLRGKIA